jgi:cation transport ATPase
MSNLPTKLLTLVQLATVTVSGVIIATAIAFGAMAIAMVGLVIGLVGALMAMARPRPRASYVTLTARRTGRGWVIDPTDR